MADLGAYLKAINISKVNIMRDSDDPKMVTDYPAFIVRRMLSYHVDAIFDANEINCLPALDEQLQFEYFLHALPKKSRFAKTHKVPAPEHLELLKTYYGYSDEKALAVMDLHTAADFLRMEKHLSEGGFVR